MFESQKKDLLVGAEIKFRWLKAMRGQDTPFAEFHLTMKDKIRHPISFFIGIGLEGRTEKDNEINGQYLLPSAAYPVEPIDGHLTFCNLRFCSPNATLLGGCKCVPCWPARPSYDANDDDERIQHAQPEKQNEKKKKDK